MIQGAITYKDVIARAASVKGVATTLRNEEAQDLSWRGERAHQGYVAYYPLVGFNPNEESVWQHLIRSGFSYEERLHEGHRDEYICNEVKQMLSDKSPEVPEGAERRSEYELDSFYALGTTDPWVRVGRSEVEIVLGMLIEFPFDEDGCVNCLAQSEVRLDNHTHYASFLGYTRLYKVLGESKLVQMPSVIGELVSNNGRTKWSWAEVSFPKLKSLSGLLKEFAQGNESVLRLVEREEVFDPAPKYRYEPRFDPTMCFIPVEHQSRILLGWHRQLEEYRGSLFVRP